MNDHSEIFVIWWFDSQKNKLNTVRSEKTNTSVYIYYFSNFIKTDNNLYMTI